MQQLKYRKAWAAIAAVLVVVGVLAVGIWVFFQPRTQATQAPKETVAEQPLRPTRLQEVQQLFGPWQLAAPNSTGAPALVMLRSDGGTDVSSWIVEVDKAWQQADPVEIVGFGEFNGNAMLRFNDGRTFIIGYGQPFIIERIPDTVYAVVTDALGSNKVVSISTDQASKLGHRR